MVEEEPEPVADEDAKSEEDGKGILPTVAEEEEDEQEVPEAEEKGEEGVPEEKGEGVIVPDLLPPAASSDRPPTEEQAQQREEPESGRPSSAAEEAHGHKPETAPARVHQYLGTTALALPAERDHRLDRVDLELQIRPQSPNGVILYAASSAPSAKEPPPTVHSLQLRNGQVHYSFRLGSETNDEVLRSEAKVPLGQWTTLRVSNDGQGRASLRLNSSAPIELFYSRPPSIPSATPSRIFLGGIDPQRSRQRPATAAAAAESVNFIGALGRVRLNQKLLKADGEPASRGWEPSREEEEEEESSSGSSLQQTENQCSRQPCLDGGRCRLDRWGGFQCQCAPGFAGPLCEFPSSDGVCPADGRRWCHRGICLWQHSADGGRPLCLCPPGWAGDRCERKEASGGDGDGIRFDGRHSFLAIPLDQWQDEDRETGMDETGGFSVEFRLNPAPSKPREDHFVAMLIRRDQTGPVAVLGLQGGQKFWALEQESGDQPSNRRFLTKRIKHRKMHRVRLEQLGPGELRLLVEGRPKGTLRADSGRTALLLLGGPAPRGQLASSNSLLAGIAPFAGCMDQLRVNGRPLDWSELAKLATAANMGTCRAESSEKGPEREKSQEVVGDRRDFLVQTTLMPIPYTQLPVESASEDPPLTQRRQEAELMGPEGEAIDGSEPTTTTTMAPTTQQTFWSDQITGTVSPDPLPSSTDRSAFVEEMPAGEAEEWEEPSASTTTEEPSPAAEEEPSSSTTRASASEDPLFSTDEPLPPETTSIWSEEEAEEEPPTTISSSTTATSTSPPAPEPTWAIGPDSAELLEGPFPGLCDHKTCGPHGNCEELNETHVFCDCRDYWVGQTCELFRPIEYAASFDGNAFVVFSSDELPHLVSDREEVIEFKLRTRAHYGLIFWQGQQPSLDMEVDLATEDFLSIGLLDGHLTFSYELGGGAAQLVSEQRVNDGRPHQIRAVRKGRNGTLVVDGGPPVRGRSSGILAMLNVEGHIFVGGVPDLHLMTAGIHTHNLVGCLAELVLNGHRLDLMANAIDGRNVRPCREWRPHRHRRGRRLLRQWRRLLRRRRQQRQLKRTIVIRN